MDIRAVIFGTFGGLAIFLYGMKSMSDGLKHIGSESFKKILGALTHNRFFAILVGMGITCFIQSSSATSVMVVGFVNAGLLALHQAVAVVLGADIGTTITAWLVSTMGIGKIKINECALPVIAVGFLMSSLAQKRKYKMTGQTLFGFGVLFLGLGIMSDGVKSVKESEMVMHFFREYGANPLLGILAGMVVTMIIQSSSATIAIIQVMAFQDIFGLDAALPLMLGANIGTTITAQLAALNGTRNARSVAMANTLFKTLAVILFLPILVTGFYERAVVFFLADRISQQTGANAAIMFQIAIAHSAFITINVVIFSTLLWSPLISLSRRFAYFSRRARDAAMAEKTRHLDPLLLNTPPIALEQCIRELAFMTSQAHKNIGRSFDAFMNKNLRSVKKIQEKEELIDKLQSDITSFLVELSRRELDIRESRAIPLIVHCINDAERIGDHAENLMELAEITVNHNLSISEAGKQDLLDYYSLVERQFRAVLHALREKAQEGVRRAVELEDQINSQYIIISNSHVGRLESGVCSIQAGVVFWDVMANLEKIGDHLINIAERVQLTSIQMNGNQESGERSEK